MSGSKVGVKGQGQGQVSDAQGSILGARLCQVQQRAKKSHYQSKGFICVCNNRSDAVDRLLIHYGGGQIKLQYINRDN